MPHSTPLIAPFSANPDFDFEIRCAIGGSPYAPGEILAAVGSVRKDDHKGWHTAWSALGDRTLAAADASAAAGHRVSAASAYLRASGYYAVAVNALSSLDDTAGLLPAFTQQNDAWEKFVDNTSYNVTRIQIPYDDDALPGYLFQTSTGSGARPTLVGVNGSDGPLSAMYAYCIQPALERGYNVLVFDGPGQQSQLFEKNVPFRPDWEHVLTPVYDFLAARDDVDEKRIGVYGVSQGGYWVTRAVAFEHRFAAAITDPGVVDVSTSWTSHLPKSLIKLLDNGEIEKFDKEMAFAMKFSPDTARTWSFRARPYGTTGYGETIAAVRAYDATSVAKQITTPLLVLAPDHEQFWPGQAEQLASLIPGVSTLVAFTAAEGADEHCQPLGRALTAERMFDWLDERLT